MNKLWLSVLLFSLLLLSVTSGNEEADSTDSPDTIMDSTTIEITTIENTTIEKTTVSVHLTLISSTPTPTSCNQSDLVKQSLNTQSDEADKEGNISIFGLYVLIFFGGFLLAIALVVTVIGFKKFRRYRQSCTSGDLVVNYVNHAFEDESKQIEYLPTHTPPMTPPLPQQPHQHQHSFLKVMKLAKTPCKKIK